MDNQKLLTIKDVSAVLKISKPTTFRWIKAKKITGFFRIGRKWLIREADFEEFINQRITNNNE